MVSWGDEKVRLQRWLLAYITALRKRFAIMELNTRTKVNLIT